MFRSRAEKKVREVAKGKVGYVHLSQMDPENLTRFQQAVARFNLNKNVQGMILDIRENGGGNIHVQLMAVLQARPFVRMQPRGLPRITQPQLHWDKPIVVLVNERSFSDAEVFPWSFKDAGLGTTIGPLVVTAVLGTGHAWRWAYVVVGTAQLLLALAFHATHGRWLEAGGPGSGRVLSVEAARSRDTLARPIVWLGMLTFFVYTGVEIVTAQWSYSLLTLGRGVPAAGFPALQAQHSVYTIKQLNDYAADTRYQKDDKGARRAGPNAPMMVTIATRLTPEDRRNLASYIQGLR